MLHSSLVLGSNLQGFGNEPKIPLKKTASWIVVVGVIPSFPTENQQVLKLETNPVTCLKYPVGSLRIRKTSRFPPFWPFPNGPLTIDNSARYNSNWIQPSSGLKGGNM